MTAPVISLQNVFDYVEDPVAVASGNAATLGGLAVQIQLNYSAATTTTSPPTYLSSFKRTVYTNTAGRWDAYLVPNTSITPSGTTYLVTTPFGSNYEIVVGSSGPYQSSSIVQTTPANLTPASQTTGNLTVNGTLTVTGATSLQSSLAVTGALTVGGGENQTGFLPQATVGGSSSDNTKTSLLLAGGLQFTKTTPGPNWGTDLAGIAYRATGETIDPALVVRAWGYDFEGVVGTNLVPTGIQWIMNLAPFGSAPDGGPSVVSGVYSNDASTAFNVARFHARGRSGDYIAYAGEAGTTGGITRWRSKDLTGAKYFEWLANHTSNAMIFQSDTNQSLQLNRNGTAAFSQAVTFPAGGVAPAAVNFTPITNSLSGNVSLNNTSNYIDGPSIAQGTSGTWFAWGQVTVYDTTGTASFLWKLWDGTTVITSGASASVGASSPLTITCSGYLASPAGNLRISVNDATHTTGLMFAAYPGLGNNSSQISAIRIA